MTPPTPTPPPSSEGGGAHDPSAVDANVALYALGALDDLELRTVETRLATDAGTAAVEARLRRAAGSMAAAAPGIDIAPPADLRRRVLAAARAERPPSSDALVPLHPAELHRIEGERLLSLVTALAPADLDLPVDPPELAGWTVRDLIAHLAAVEAFTAESLGVRAPTATGSGGTNEEQSRQAIARHRTLTPAESSAELEHLLVGIDEHVAALADLDHRVAWWHGDLSVGEVLIMRSFELWTHASDIARAVGRPEPIPSAPALLTMSQLATAATPTMCAVAGAAAPHDATHSWVRFELTGPGGATHDVAIHPNGSIPSGSAPTATITVDIVDYCRAVGNRADRSGLAYRHTGDASVAAAVVASLPALATL